MDRVLVKQRLVSRSAPAERLARKFTAYGRLGAEGGKEDTHQRRKGRLRHNETRVQLNRQSAGTEANGVEEHAMRVLWRRQQQRHRSQSRAPQMTWQSFCLDDRRAGANDG